MANLHAIAPAKTAYFHTARAFFKTPGGSSDCGCYDTDRSNSAPHPTHPSIFFATGRGAHRPRKPWWGDRHGGALKIAEGDLSLV